MLHTLHYCLSLCSFAHHQSCPSKPAKHANTKDSRVFPLNGLSSLARYNKNVQNWNLVDSKLFANKTFFYEVDNITRYMNVSSSHEGSYWPVRDDCHSHKDPPEGCLPTDTLYYVQKSVHIHSPAPVTFYFNDVHNLMANYTVSSFIKTTKNAIDLECEHDLYVPSPTAHA